MDGRRGEGEGGRRDGRRGEGEGEYRFMKLMK
jgi:hypothetical protein